MKKLLMLKIGGGVITDKKVRYGLKAKVLEQIVREVARAREELKETDLIIGNGAGSFAHFSAKKYGTAKGFNDARERLGAGWVRYDAVLLNQIVFEKLLGVGVPAFSFSASSMMQVNNDQVEKIVTGGVEKALEKGLVPLLYGDVMVDASKGATIFSTERIFDELAKKLVSKYANVRVIHISSEEGVLVGEKVFSKITNSNYDQIKEALAGSEGIDVTGGMLHKIEACLGVAKLGIESTIVSGLVRGRVAHALVGDNVVGTKICM